MLSHVNRFAQSVALVVIFAAVSVASPPLTITDSGYYLTVLDSAGNPALEQITSVVDLRTSVEKPETPETPNDPTAKPPDGISADVATWASEVNDPQAAQVYALIFEVVRDGVTDGQVSSGDLFTVLKKSADAIVDSQWESFRRRLGDYLTEQLQTGKLSEKQQIANQLELIRYGLAYSARGSDSITAARALSSVATVNEIIDKEASQ